MYKSWVRHYVLLAVLIVALTAGWLIAVASHREPVEMEWQQSTSLSVRLGVKGKQGPVEAYEALFTVSRLDYPNGQLWHEIKKRVVPGEFKYLYFPEDFHVKGQAGKYEWTCKIGDEVVARGRFEYIGEDGERNEARVEK